MTGSELLKAIVSPRWTDKTLDRDPDEFKQVLAYLSGARHLQIPPATLDYYGIDHEPYDYIWNQNMPHHLVRLSELPIPTRVRTIGQPDTCTKDSMTFYIRPRDTEEGCTFITKCIGGTITRAVYHNRYTQNTLFDERVSSVIDIPVTVNLVNKYAYLECTVDKIPGTKQKLCVSIFRDVGKQLYRSATSYSGVNRVEFDNCRVSDIYFKGRPGIVSLTSSYETLFEISSDAIAEEFEVVGDIYHLSWPNMAIWLGETDANYQLTTSLTCEKIIVVTAGGEW